MNADIRAAVGLVAVIAFLVGLFIGLIRFVVPAILEAHFYGSVALASATGVLGVLAIIALAANMLPRFMDRAKRPEESE